MLNHSVTARKGIKPHRSSCFLLFDAANIVPFEAAVVYRYGEVFSFPILAHIRAVLESKQCMIFLLAVEQISNNVSDFSTENS